MILRYSMDVLDPLLTQGLFYFSMTFYALILKWKRTVNMMKLRIPKVTSVLIGALVGLSVLADSTAEGTMDL